MFDTTGMYYHGPVSIFALTFPIFHPPFFLLNTHLHHPRSSFNSNTCVIGPHTSLLTTIPKTAYHLINIVVMTQTLLFASSIADLLNNMCPLGNNSYIRLTFLLRLVSPWCIHLPFPWQFLFRHVSQDAIYSLSSPGCCYISTGKPLHLYQREYAVLLVMISYLLCLPHLCQCVSLRVLVVWHVMPFHQCLR